MSEEEKLEAIRQEIAAQNYYQNKANNHLWWLSTFLVKVPVAIGCFCLIVLGSRKYGSSAPENETHMVDTTPLMSPSLLSKWAFFLGGCGLIVLICRWWISKKPKELE